MSTRRWVNAAAAALLLAPLAARGDAPSDDGPSLVLAVRAGAGLAAGELAPGRRLAAHLGPAPTLAGEIGARWSSVAVTAFLQNHFGVPRASTGVDAANAAVGGLRLTFEPWRADPCSDWSPWLAAGAGVAGAIATIDTGSRIVTAWSSRGVAAVLDAGLERRLGQRLSAGLLLTATVARVRTETAYDADGEPVGTSAVRAGWRLLQLAARLRY